MPQSNTPQSNIAIRPHIVRWGRPLKGAHSTPTRLSHVPGPWGTRFQLLQAFPVRRIGGRPTRSARALALDSRRDMSPSTAPRGERQPEKPLRHDQWVAPQLSLSPIGVPQRDPRTDTELGLDASGHRSGSGATTKARHVAQSNPPGRVNYQRSRPTPTKCPRAPNPSWLAKRSSELASGFIKIGDAG